MGVTVGVGVFVGVGVRVGVGVLVAVGVGVLVGVGVGVLVGNAPTSIKEVSFVFACPPDQIAVEYNGTLLCGARPVARTVKIGPEESVYAVDAAGQLAFEGLHIHT